MLQIKKSLYRYWYRNNHRNIEFEEHSNTLAAYLISQKKPKEEYV